MLINFGGTLYWIFSWGKGEDNHDGVHSMPKLGGLGACSPRTFLKFTTSETASGGYLDH